MRRLLRRGWLRDCSRHSTIVDIGAELAGEGAAGPDGEADERSPLNER